jgi:AcrR family transcriptional regulator
MGVKERRERQRAALRQEILDAARELFVREGFENVSMRRVAEKIEYSPTTIYLHFKDKADLLFCLCEETFAKLVSTFKAIGEDLRDPLDCLKKGLRAYVDFGLRHPNHYKVTFIVHPEFHEDQERFLHEETMGMKAFNYLRMMVEECVKQKKFRKVDVEMASQALWAAVHGVTSLLIVHPDFPWVQKSKLIDTVIDTMIEGLKA